MDMALWALKEDDFGDKVREAVLNVSINPGNCLYKHVPLYSSFSLMTGSY